MRVLITVDPEIPVPPTHYGGIERIVAGLIAELTDGGHEVGLIAHPDSSAPAARLFPWAGRSSQGRGDTLRNMLTLRRVAGTFRPDVLHSFSRLWYLASLLRSSLPKVMSYQREPSPRPVRRAAALGRDSLRFTGCSESVCRAGRQGGGSWTAIHNFVDVRKLTFTPSVADDAPLVFLSRVESIKGPHLAIDAARRAGRRLVIAGNHSATPAEARYWETRIKPQIGRDGVEYVGPVDDEQKYALLGSAAALIVPIQWSEPFGIVFAEALACGTPVISCPRGALPEIVDNGRTGRLVETAAELPEAIASIGSLQRAECRRTAEARFSTEVVCRQYVELYEEAHRHLPRREGASVD